MPTKHEQILAYIYQLTVGEKISVRQIAKKLNVSEGTAYRAIKEAETQGLVSTIGRVGTIRIEKQEKKNIERLTFAEVVNIVDGTVIGGRAGLHKTLHKFVIGAMKLEDMMRYVEAGSLLIVGNRAEGQRLALQHGAAVLITGGFDTDEDIKQLADECKLPIISCSYDTFTVASMINRAIYDRLIKKEIMLVEDILIPREEAHYLYVGDNVKDWYELSERTKHSRFPVIDHNGRVHGVVTSKDIISLDENEPIEKVMTKQPITVKLQTSVASAAHRMIWEGIELLPVVIGTNHHHEFAGIITRQDVLKAMQLIQKQPQMGETFEDLIITAFEEGKDERGLCLRGRVTPQMTNHMGTISSGVMTTILTNAGERALGCHKKGDLVTENVTLYFLKPVQIENELTVYPNVLELSRKFGQVDIEAFHEGQIVAKALLSAQLIDRS